MGSRDVPFLVMCGTFDPRLPIAQGRPDLAVARLRVSVEWPRLPHLSGTGRAAWSTKPSLKYLRRTVDFFRGYTQRK
jgi:hypothetical protein